MWNKLNIKQRILVGSLSPLILLILLFLAAVAGAPLWLLLPGVLVVSAGAVYIAFFLARDVTAPLLALSRVADQIAAGDLQLKPDTSRRDETGLLARSLDKMLMGMRDAMARSDKLVTHLKNLPTPVMEIDTDFNVVFMNAVGAGAVGLSPEDCVGKKCYQLVNGTDCATPQCALRRAMDSGEKVESRMVARPATGLVLPVTYTGVPLKDDTGNIRGALEYVMDQSAVYDIAAQLQETSRQLEGVTQNMEDISSRLNHDADGMSSQSHRASEAAGHINANVATVASGAEQAAANVMNMAAAAEQMSQNVATVASAIEEMNASLSEVAKNTVEAARVAEDAAGKTENTVSIMDELDRVADAIGKVVKMIGNVADQTNMLALNATIEAAGAGEAGKGFAVVAGEVKALAKQTADSTEEIAEQIDNIQKTARNASAAVDSVKESILANTHIVNLIASSIEEQTATISEISRTVSQTAGAAREVARNADEATQGVKEIARSATQMSGGVNDVTQTIRMVGQTGDDVTTNSHKVKELSDILVQQVAALNAVVNDFTLLEKLKE